MLLRLAQLDASVELLHPCAMFQRWLQALHKLDVVAAAMLRHQIFPFPHIFHPLLDIRNLSLSHLEQKVPGIQGNVGTLEGLGSL